MSSIVLKDMGGKYRKVMSNIYICKYKINGICCNEKSECYRQFPIRKNGSSVAERKCIDKRSCKYYEGENILDITRRRK